MPFTSNFPTPQHTRAAAAITEFFAKFSAVDSVLLMGSCARGKASPDSCLDILILLRPEAYARNHEGLEQTWWQHYESQKVYQELRQVGAFSQVDLELIDGRFDPAHSPHGWTSGADEFELEVGNSLAYTVPLWEAGSYYRELKERWLPYYADDLRRERLEMVLKYCRNNLKHIPLYAPRGLYFQSFKRLYHAFEEFLQALFISRRTYPIAYDKWVQEEVVDILGLPDLYARLPHILELPCFESLEIVARAQELETLIDTYIQTD